MDRPLQSLPPTYAPSLVFLHGINEVNQTFCTLNDECIHTRRVPEMRGMECNGSYFGWMILQSFYTAECYLFNPVLLTKINLPPLPHDSYDLSILTSHPSDPNCLILFVSAEEKSLIFCRIGDSKWIEPTFVCNEKSIEFVEGPYSSLLCCKGRLYLLCDSGMAVIEIHGSCASIEVHEDKFVNKSVPEIYHSSYHLVESCGDVFKVVLLHVGHSRSIVRSFDVYKLDLSSMDWTMVKSLGDRIFLLDVNSISFSAKELGVKGNSIYFLLEGVTSFHRFDMDDGTIKSSLPCLEKNLDWLGPFWVIPTCKTEVQRNTLQISASYEHDLNEERSWKHLPRELLELILSLVSGPGVIRFRLTSKTWTSLRQWLIRPNSVVSNSDPEDFPCLMTFPRFNKGTASFHHPIYNDSYFASLPQLSGTIVREAKHGWLLMSEGLLSTFFFNPLTCETIKLPDFEYCYELCGFSFSSPPTLSDCIALGIEKANYSHHLTMLVYQKWDDDATWSVESYSLENEPPNEFVPSENCNPVFYDGKFYCLGKDGKLGCFDPKETEDEKLQWIVLPVPPVTDDDTRCSTKSFIVEYDGEILSVFVDHVVGDPIQVYTLDWSEMKWIAVDCLGNKVIFLSPTRSIMMPAGLKGIENRIYFPKFNGKDNMFYSLQTGDYHCFGSDLYSAGWMGTYEFWNCTWFQVAKEKTQPTQPQPENQ